jgi:hypothetical protein
MRQNITIKVQLFLILVLFSSITGMSQPLCTWNPEKKELAFSLSEISGILNCDINSKHAKSHHFSNVIHKPSGMLVSPDGGSMAGTGMLNFFRVLVQGGYLTELRVEDPLFEPEADGLTMTWMPTIRRQAKVKVQFTFKQPNIIDMDIWVETLTTYPAFEILASAYLAPGFESGVYVAKEEFGSTDPQQIRLVDQPMIHGIWPFFPRDEAGANLLTDGRHQKDAGFGAWR